MNILSKRLLLSVGLLGAVAVTGVVSQAHSQDVIQSWQQKQDQLHDKITQHNQNMENSLQKNREQIDHYKNYTQEQKDKFKSKLDAKKQQAQEKIDHYKNYTQEQKDKFKSKLDAQKQQSAERSAQQRKEWKDLKNSSKQNAHDLMHPFSNN